MKLLLVLNRGTYVPAFCTMITNVLCEVWLGGPPIRIEGVA